MSSAQPLSPVEGGDCLVAEGSPVATLVAMPGYSVTSIGSKDTWRDHFGGFIPETSRNGRRVVDHELDTEVIGFIATA